MTSTASIAMWRSTRPAMPVCRHGVLVESPSGRLAKRQYVNQPAQAVPI